MFNCCLCIDERTLLTLFGVFILKTCCFMELMFWMALERILRLIGVCLEDDFDGIYLFRCAMHKRWSLIFL
jgi:hypothetical protein